MGTVAPAEVCRDLMFLLSQASYVLNTELTAALARLGISPRHYCVLKQAMAGDYTQIRLAELCGLDKTTMVVTIDELEKTGLAERRPFTSDRRVRIIAVTDDGARKVADAEKLVAEIYDDVLGSLPEHEREPFLSGLARLVGGRLSTPVHCERPVRRRSPKA
jgi:MarR family transcriptional regulator for hemolysin